jgi:hypothetical protein
MTFFGLSIALTRPILLKSAGDVLPERSIGMANQMEELSLSDVELWAEVDRLARSELHVDGSEAFRRLDAGEFRGSILEAKLSMLRFLLGEDAPRVAAE